MLRNNLHLLTHRTFTTKYLPQNLHKTISIIEVGPRDGLQNESKHLSLPKKINFLQKCMDAGFKNIESGSLVNYKLIPSMENTLEAIQHSSSNYSGTISILVPHIREWNKYFNSPSNPYYSSLKNIKEVVLFVSCSDTFNSKNINTNKAGAFQRFRDIINGIRSSHPHIRFRGSISCCWGCPYEKTSYIDVLPSILECIKEYQSLGVSMIDICDTIGVATPESTHNLLQSIFKEYDPSLFSLHLHDTNGLAVACSMVGVNLGIRTLQGSLAGIGGCPFSSKRVGNVDTIALCNQLYLSGFYTGINIEKATEIKDWLLKELK
jgi:hydroxymethylglutaryl-CoA lyase